MLTCDADGCRVRSPLCTRNWENGPPSVEPIDCGEVLPFCQIVDSAAQQLLNEMMQPTREELRARNRERSAREAAAAQRRNLGHLQYPSGHFSPPQAESSQPFSNPGWIFEPKWDGYRALCFLKDGKVRFILRNRRNLTRRFPELSKT